METKNQKWRRLCGARLEKLVHQHKLIGNCARKSDYDYSKQDAEKLCAWLFRGVIANCEHYGTDPTTIFSAALNQYRATR